MQVMLALLMALALEPGADPSSMDLLQGARSAMALGNYEQAITQLNDAKEKDPTNQEIPKLLAEARQKSAASYVATGRKLLSERKYADALVAFDNALDLTPADALAKRGREAAQKWPRAEAYCKSAQDYLKKGDFDYAIAYYEKAYELTKDPSIGKWLAAAKAANAKKR
jgi:tetratricopeptide (TPR) repeat protein